MDLQDGGVSLLEQSAGWLVPYVALLLVMVYAMMEFTVTLLSDRPSSPGEAIPPDELRQRLLALNEGDQGLRMAKGDDCDLEIRWQMGEVPRAKGLAITRGGGSGSIRLLLDERRHDLRLHQVTRSYFFFLGLSGWVPRLAGGLSFAAGPPGQAMTREIAQVTRRAGWTVRPVLWWFQATYRGTRLLELLTLAPLRRWPARRFWGVLYPLTYLLAMGCFVAIAGPLEGQALLLMLGISAIWWGVWGILAWALLGFAAFWRGRPG